MAARTDIFSSRVARNASLVRSFRTKGERTFEPFLPKQTGRPPPLPSLATRLVSAML